LIENPLYAFVPCNRWPMGRGRRQISELGGKGYWREDMRSTGTRAYERLYWQVCAGAAPPGFATNFQPSRANLGSMGIRPKHVEKAMRALRRRQPLLEAWLDALNRLEGPSCQIVRFRNTAQQRRPLMQSAERHRASRHRSPHLLIVQTGPLPR
jgi:hypothetical protein